MFDLNVSSFQALFGVLLGACVLVIFINNHLRSELIKNEDELTRLKGHTKFQHHVYTSSLKEHNRTIEKLSDAVKNKIAQVETTNALLKAANERARRRMLTILAQQKELEEIKK